MFDWLTDQMTETLIACSGSLINAIILTIIFLFLNNVLFLSRYFKYDTKENRKIINKKLRRLVPLSPIALIVVLVLVLISLTTLANIILREFGIKSFINDTVIMLNINSDGISLETAETNTDALLLLFVIAFIVAIPVFYVILKRYCKVIGCTYEMGMFVYMAVLFMYITSALITLPIKNITASSLISSASFIVMLLIFYLPYEDKIELMRQNENTNMIKKINRLPIMNFFLLLILLGLEFMLMKTGQFNTAFYIVILVFAVLLYTASQLSYGILFKHIDESKRILDLSKESLASQEQVMLQFAEITEAKSGQTGHHVKRVSEYTRVIATAMGLDPKVVNDMRVASMMHDVGKLLIPPEILEKTGKLTDEEFKVMKEHVEIGRQLLLDAHGEIMDMARDIAQQHHEWINGNGYLGMKGDEISLGARICAVADVYDALTSVRSYKKAWTPEEAYKMIDEEAGTHFDPDVVNAFKEHFDEIVHVQEFYHDDSSTYRF